MTTVQPLVLLVDDSPEDLELYRSILASDYRMIEAENGPMALALVRDQKPEVVLLDYRLPGMDGLAVLKRLRADSGPHASAVVMLTGTMGDRLIGVNAMKAGAQDFIEKDGFTPDSLRRTVAHALETVRLERELARQREYFAVTLRSIGDAVIATDSEARITFMNRVAEDLTGWTMVESVGKPVETVFRIINEHTRATVESPVAKVLKEGMVVGLANHTLLIRKDEQEIPIDDSGAPILDGELIGVALVFRDISERRRQERALEESEARFRTLADNMAPLAWMAHPNGDVFWYNQRWFNYTGEQLSTMRGWGWTKMHHPDHVERVVNRIQLAWDTGEPWEDTFPLRGKDGTYRWFLSRALPIRDDHERIVRWFGTSTDITELRDVHEALQETDRRKDDFLGMLAHELRNPLAPLHSAAYFLKHSNLAEPSAHKATEIVERQVNHLARLVDDLLDATRIARGKILLRKAHCDLVATVRDTVEDYRHTLEQDKLTLSLVLPEQPLWIEGDPTRLAQMVGNLLNNAHKFSNPGGVVTVELKMESNASDTREARLTVHDTGIGIEPEMLKQVFEVFAQADRSIQRSRGGLGLGLALVKGLTELHGGSITAASDGLGNGASFSLRLPLATRPPDGMATPVDDLCTNVQQLRLLIIEDNQDAAFALQTLLEQAGHCLATARTGVAGIELARRFRPDVILCDIGLQHGMTGYDVARSVRSDPTLMDVTLLALTGYAREEDIRAAVEAGFDRHLVKPVDVNLLLNLLLKIRPRYHGKS